MLLSTSDVAVNQMTIIMGADPYGLLNVSQAQHVLPNLACNNDHAGTCLTCQSRYII